MFKPICHTCNNSTETCSFSVLCHHTPSTAAHMLHKSMTNSNSSASDPGSAHSCTLTNQGIAKASVKPSQLQQKGGQHCPSSSPLCMSKGFGVIANSLDKIQKPVGPSNPYWWLRTQLSQK